MTGVCQSSLGIPYIIKVLILFNFFFMSVLQCIYISPNLNNFGGTSTGKMVRGAFLLCVAAITK